MTKPSPSRTVMVYATVDSYALQKGQVAYALHYCASTKSALTGYLLNLDANAAPVGASVSLDQQRDFYEQRATANQANAQQLLTTASERGVSAEVVTTIDHSRGVIASVADRARLHDVIITGANRRGMMSDRVITEGLLFETGRPVLIVPDDHYGQYAAKTLALAWDNSPHAARALGDALAHLPDVAEIVLLTVGGEREIRNSLSDQQVIDALSRRGISSRLVRLEANGATVGDVLQTGAINEGADLVAMGGFGHSRLRDFILGGATLSVLDNPRLPFLLSH